MSTELQTTHQGGIVPPNLTSGYSLVDEIAEGFKRDLNSENRYTANNAKNVIEYFEQNRTIVATKIQKYNDMGLSYANKDFYVLVRGNEVQMPIDYKAYARVVVKSASDRGYDLFIEADVIREEYKGGYIRKRDAGDDVLVINNPITGRIISPWARYVLLSNKTHDIISSKIEIVPNDEYQNAMSAGGKNGGVGQIHKNYATEGAKKIAIRRLTKHLEYMFPHLRELQIADDEDLEAMRGKEIPQPQNSPMDTRPEPTQGKTQTKVRLEDYED